MWFDNFSQKGDVTLKSRSYDNYYRALCTLKYVLDKSLKLSSFQTDRKGSDLLIYHCSCCSDNIKRQMMPDHSQLQPQLSAQGCRKRGGMGVPLQIWADWSTLSQPEGEGGYIMPPICSDLPTSLSIAASIEAIHTNKPSANGIKGAL